MEVVVIELVGDRPYGICTYVIDMANWKILAKVNGSLYFFEPLKSVVMNPSSPIYSHGYLVEPKYT